MLTAIQRMNAQVNRMAAGDVMSPENLEELETSVRLICDLSQVPDAAEYLVANAGESLHCMAMCVYLTLLLLLTAACSWVPGFSSLARA